MGRTWTFRADRQLDPILERWTAQSEKSFHVRQALRQYLFGSKQAVTAILIPDEHSLPATTDGNIQANLLNP